MATRNSSYVGCGIINFDIDMSNKVEIIIEAAMSGLNKFAINRMVLSGDKKLCVEALIATCNDHPEFRQLIENVYKNLDKSELKWHEPEKP